MSSSGTVQPNWGSSASASASSSAARPPRSSTLQGGTSRGSGRGNFTARMQDRQARNKNPRTGLVDSDDSYTHDDDDEDEEGEGDDNDEYDDDDEEGRLRAMKKPTR
ncbi:MAG: hypothetical protein M1818_005381 [Claussenomyces sp. TS43310]|nr:MAG: hypothetical protein M1818_005381 [Claussenomyces sp. TS43310]